MHELSIVEGILSIVREAMKEHEGGALQAVGLRVGPLAGLEPEILTFCFEALIRETPFEGAVLEITTVPVTGRCASCALQVTIGAMEFLCPECGSPLSIEGGRELEISHIEVG
jgi:hydrogenase nickel incorporation protein HypA/HybF